MGYGSDFVTLPDFEVTKDRIQAVSEFVKHLPNAAITQSYGDYEEFQTPIPELSEILSDVMSALKRDASFRDVALMQLPGMDYVCRVSGGKSYDGPATDSVLSFDTVGRLPGLWNLLLDFARVDTNGAERFMCADSSNHFSYGAIPAFKLNSHRIEELQTLVEAANKDMYPGLSDLQVLSRLKKLQHSEIRSRRDVNILRLPGMNFSVLVSAGTDDWPADSCQEFELITGWPQLWNMLMEFAVQDCQDDELNLGGRADYIEGVFRQGWLDLDELTELTPEQANSLRWYVGHISLKSVTDLPCDVASRLALHKGRLCLGINSLSEDLAESLAVFSGEGLVVEEVMTLSDAAAKNLAKMPATDLYLNGLTELPVNVAVVLAKRKGFLSLDSLTAITNEAVEALKNFRGRIDLCGISDDRLDELKNQLPNCELNNRDDSCQPYSTG